MQAHRERGTPAPDDGSVHSLGGRQVAVELENDPGEALVGHEQVRAEPDDRHRQALLLGPGEKRDQLLDRRGTANQRAGPPVPIVV